MSVGACKGIVISKEKPVLYKVILLAIVRKKLHMNTCRFLKGFRRNLQTSPRFFFLCCWIKREVHKRRLDAPDELLARNLDASDGIMKREDQLRRRARNLRLRVSKCNVVDGDIFENLF